MANPLCRCGCGQEVANPNRIVLRGHNRPPIPIGHRVGMLVVADAPKMMGTNFRWKCKCDCGQVTYVRRYELQAEKVKSCGCLLRRYVDHAGRRFGHLVAIRRQPPKHWLCRCDCGNEKVVPTVSLSMGLTNSCGCIGQEALKRYRTRHGPGEGSRRALLFDYKRHAGGRDLEWSLTDDQFYNLTRRRCTYCGIEPHSVIKSSTRGSYVYNGVDRADSALGYTPANSVPCCKTCNRAKMAMKREDFAAWVDRLIDVRLHPEKFDFVTPVSAEPFVRANDWQVKTITARGKTQSISAWEKETGLSYSVLKGRIRLDWSSEDVVGIPAGVSRHRVLLTAFGETHDMAAWCRKTGLSRSVIKWRLNIGCTHEEALAPPGTRYKGRKLRPPALTLPSPGVTEDPCQ